MQQAVTPLVTPIEVQTPWMDRLDAAVDDHWGAIFRGHPHIDRAFYLASELGDFSLIWHILNTAQGLRTDERDADATIRMAVVMLLESLVVNQGVKRLFRRPRPVSLTPRPHKLRTPSTTSFPSGHATSAFTAAGLLSDRDPKMAPLYYGLAAVVATSRVHVKIHHATDVLAGAAVGIVFAKVAVKLWKLPPRHQAPAVEAAAAIQDRRAHEDN
ncbi:MAG: phosphatase PAP2 family protein [Aquihabitans sp.]